MLRYFDSVHTHEARAVQIWQILTGLAHNRKTITYTLLADILGFKGAGVFSQLLDPIMVYCKQNQLPPLTILVVKEDTGSPGTGLNTIENENLDREKVFNYPWYKIYPPTEEDYLGLR